MLASCDKTRPIYLRRPLAEVELSARAHSTAAVQSKEMVFFLRFLCAVCVLTFYFKHNNECGSNSIGTRGKKRQRSYSSCAQSREFNGGVCERRV